MLHAPIRTITMKKLFYIFLILFPCIFQAQSVEFEKANFPGRKDELKEAIRKLQLGTEFYTMGRKEYDDVRKNSLITKKYYPVSVRDYMQAGLLNFKNASASLNDAHRFNPKNADLNYMLGLINFFTDPRKKETLEHLENAFELGPNTNNDVAYWLAWAYQLNTKWDDALKYYDFYLKILMIKAKSNAAAIEDVKKKISECEVGKKFSANPERVFVDNLGATINTQYPEYGPCITADESMILFTARRPNSIGGKRDDSDNGYYEDVYYSMKVDDKWTSSKQLSKNVNTEFHDAAAGLSPDGNKLYVYRDMEKDGGDIYESILFGLDWEEPVRMNKFINTKYHESSVSISYDGKRLYFVSDKEPGMGDRDIYYSDMDINGEWGPSKNIGADINTKYGEDGVFMHPDGLTLYFSSKGHGTMGGYDIFKTTFENGKWLTPINLGYPINGPDDDVFFVVGGNGNRAYFASAKPGGYGDQDIYMITFLGPEKQPILNTQDQLLASSTNAISELKTEIPTEVKSAKLTILKGIVADEKTEKPLESTIELIDNEKNTVLATFKSNKATGKYLVTLPSGHNYGIAVKANGYLFHSENIDLPQATDFQEFTLNIDMKKLEIGSTVVLRNIFYDSDKSTLRKESENELRRLVKLLQDNATMTIELSSHTDDVGAEDYNMRLSFERSNTVVDYLISKGIASSRLVPKGYGESKPIAKNDSEKGRQKNRRTEFKILSK
jgi:outer membrane protein OmpA-like peptidoglycan-associated protein/tetratricopeptide (TPR) repeat protein